MMAFSLEAALVIPLALGSWIGLLSAAPHVYSDASRTAGLEVRSSCLALKSRHLYQTDELSSGRCAVSALQVSPQAVLEISSLAVDGGLVLGRIIDSLTGGAGDFQRGGT